MDGDRLTQAMGYYRRHVLTWLQRFWHWWSGQLLGMLPANARQRLFRPGQQLCIYSGPDHYQLQLQPGGQLQALTDIPPSERQQLLQKASQVHLYLPASELLQTKLTLPAATAGDLENVLRFEMDRHTPFTADQVYFGFTASPQKKNQPHIDVTVLLAPRERIDTYLTELAELELYPVRLFSADNTDAPAITLPVSSVRTFRKAGRLKNLNGALVLVMLFLLIAVPLYHRQNRIDSLTSEINQPRQRAEQTAALKRELASLRNSLAFLGKKQSDRNPTLPLLSELTQQLPDHTWLTRLELEHDTLQIRGESANASELIGLLEGSALFSDVRFSSPITNNPATNKERFMITARLAEGGAP
ncbi:PilN domain-containing protein [Oceanimonas baumannii]|uniref:General secretion pathway protein GspL n=1 Tax=Oceanimonas baumannii TaxID=129578 RepID=A0A235CDX2_9GAMM|nr:PilN domain-containing protein [Oceanimonas baumannii]OYD22732.1 general secretion pathway protein GspL [Oceanimonas baumannii]TDW57697.1 general secretion pathway protein L [Oceanimonas baumannii]